MCECLYFSLFVVTLLQLKSGNLARKRTQVCPHSSRFTFFSLIERGKKIGPNVKNMKKNQKARNMEGKKIRLAAMWKLKNANNMELVSII